MRVFISKTFSSALEKYPEKELGIFNEKVDALKTMNKSDIVESKDVIKLIDTKDMVVYAYNIGPSVYVLFAFLEKNKLVLFDKIELIGENEIKSIAYPDVIVKEKDEDV